MIVSVLSPESSPVLKAERCSSVRSDRLSLPTSRRFIALPGGRFALPGIASVRLTVA